MAADPCKAFYLKGYADAKAGRRNSPAVPHNFKLSYVSGRHDAFSGKPSRYSEEKERV